MKAVLISISPWWCELIASGEKTLEIRKSLPKLETPFKSYIYQTKRHWFCTALRKMHELSGNSRFLELAEVLEEARGKVIGEFVCDYIKGFDVPYPAYQNRLDPGILKESCVTYYQLHRYAYHDDLYGWHISKLVIYDKPKELCEFSPDCKYKNDDGTCPSKKIACSYQREYYNPDGSVCVVECGKRIERPPQSWCYVEGQKGGEDVWR